jgi:hypothetical protein
MLKAKVSPAGRDRMSIVIGYQTLNKMDKATMILRW